MRARPRSELPAGRSSLHVGGGGEAAAGSRGNAAPDATLRTRARMRVAASCTCRRVRSAKLTA